MKKIVLVAICAAGLVSGAAQGAFNFLNQSGPVSDADGALVGAGVFGQVWAGASADSLAPVGSAVDGALPGTGVFLGGRVEVPGVTGNAFVQLRAWSGGDGTFAGADANGQSDVVELALATGQSPLGNLNTGAFSLSAVDTGTPVIPEPSTYALAALGAGLLFFRRRK